MLALFATLNAAFFPAGVEKYEAVAFLVIH